MPKTYTVKYERDAEGWWVAEAVGISAATQGRTIEQARERVREAIAVFVDVETSKVVIGKEITRLSRAERRALNAAERAKAKAKKQFAHADQAVRDAARTLTKSGMSLRDAGTLLGLTRQRVHQMLE